MPDKPQRDDSSAEPRQEDLGRRSFAGENVAADQRRQARERAATFETNRAARGPEREPVNDTTGIERDGNGDPLGGMTPEDDLD